MLLQDLPGFEQLGLGSTLGDIQLICYFLVRIPFDSIKVENGPVAIRKILDQTDNFPGADFTQGTGRCRMRIIDNCPRADKNICLVLAQQHEALIHHDSARPVPEISFPVIERAEVCVDLHQSVLQCIHGILFFAQVPEADSEPYRPELAIQFSLCLAVTFSAAFYGVVNIHANTIQVVLNLDMHHGGKWLPGAGDFLKYENPRSCASAPRAGMAGCVKCPSG